MTTVHILINSNINLYVILNLPEGQWLRIIQTEAQRTIFRHSWSSSHKKRSLILRITGAPDKPCGGGHTDANSKTVAIRYMIENKLVPLHYES